MAFPLQQHPRLATILAEVVAQMQVFRFLMQALHLVTMQRQLH